MSESEKGEFEKRIEKKGIYGYKDDAWRMFVMEVAKEMDESFPTYESVIREFAARCSKPVADRKILRVLNAKRCTWANRWFGHKKEEKKRLPK